MTEREERIVFLKDYCTRLRGAACERCVQACPAQALSFTENGFVAINHDTCSKCGICLGICDAFASTQTSFTDIHAQLRRIAVSGSTALISCRQCCHNISSSSESTNNVVILPCLAMCSPEFWTLILSENLPFALAIDFDCCASCKIGGAVAEMLYTYAIEAAESYVNKEIPFVDVSVLRQPASQKGTPSQERRELFSHTYEAVRDIASGTYRLQHSKKLQAFFEEQARSKARNSLSLDEMPVINPFAPQDSVPPTLFPKREMLLEALGYNSSIAENIPVTISETDENSCNNCLKCLVSCATGARQADTQDGTLRFSPSYCIGCDACENACPQEAIHLIQIQAAALLSESEAL